MRSSMRLAVLLACFGAAVPGSLAWSQNAAAKKKGPSLKEQFEALDDQRDHDAVVALWRKHPGRALQVIDSYLEGSLAIWEKSRADGSDEIKAMHARALRGARAADEALGRPNIGDYTSAFVGWKDAEKKAFRQGQAHYKEAVMALREGNAEKALEAGRRCRDVARPLGDWWGTAMGWSAIGRAQARLGQAEPALEALSVSRLTYQGLGLDRSAYRCQLDMVPLLVELERYPRARYTIRSALVVAEQSGDTKGRARLLEQRALVEERTGDPEAARKTRQQIPPSAGQQSK